MNREGQEVGLAQPGLSFLLMSVVSVHRPLNHPYLHNRGGIK